MNVSEWRRPMEGEYRMNECNEWVNGTEWHQPFVHHSLISINWVEWTEPQGTMNWWNQERDAQCNEVNEINQSHTHSVKLTELRVNWWLN